MGCKLTSRLFFALLVLAAVALVPPTAAGPTESAWDGVFEAQSPVMFCLQQGGECIPTTCVECEVGDAVETVAHVARPVVDLACDAWPEACNPSGMLGAAITTARDAGEDGADDGADQVNQTANAAIEDTNGALAAGINALGATPGEVAGEVAALSTAIHGAGRGATTKADDALPKTVLINPCSPLPSTECPIWVYRHPLPYLT